MSLKEIKLEHLDAYMISKSNLKNALKFFESFDLKKAITKKK